MMPQLCLCYWSNTGELKEIKQDISSLRFELLEKQNHDMRTITELIIQLGDVVDFQQEEEQKPGVWLWILVNSYTWNMHQALLYPPLSQWLKTYFFTGEQSPDKT